MSTTTWTETKTGRWEARIGPFTAVIGLHSGLYDGDVFAYRTIGEGDDERTLRICASISGAFLEKAKAECERNAAILAEHVCSVADDWRKTQ